MKKYKIARRFFSIGQTILLRRMFHQIYVKRVAVTSLTTIIVNHSNFYDSLILFELQKKQLLPHNIFAIMNKSGLEKFPLFKGVGILPVSEPMKLSEYKLILQQMKTNHLLIFPEGKEQHLEKRPIQIEPGVVELLKKNPQHHLLFVTLYYSYSSGIRGEIACQMHTVNQQACPSDNLQYFIERTMEQQLNLLKGDVINANYDDYETIWKH